MIKVIKQGIYYQNGKIEKEAQAFMTTDKKEKAVKNTLTYSILKAHGGQTGGVLFDSLLSDVNELDYDRAILSGVQSLGLNGFTIPYTLAAGGADVLCAAAALEAAEAFGGTFVGSGVASASFYLNDCGAKRGDMILTSFGVSAGATGAMCVAGEEYDFLSQCLRMPFALGEKEIVGVFVKGKLRRGVGAIDVGLSFLNAFDEIDARDKIFEFFGPGVANLSLESRIVIDRIVRETECFSTVWETEASAPAQPAFYDGGVGIDLTRVEPMISVSGKIYPLDEFMREEISSPESEFLRRVKGEAYLNGGLIDGVVGGTFENIAEFAEILRGAKVGGDYRVCPVSRSVYRELAKSGYLNLLCEEGVSIGEVGAANQLYDLAAACATAGRRALIRLDARTLALSALRGGKLCSALEYEKEIKRIKKYVASQEDYDVVSFFGKQNEDLKRELGDFEEIPAQEALPENLVSKFVCVYGANDETNDWSYPEADEAGRYFDGDEEIVKAMGSFVPARNTRYSYAAASVYPDEICGAVCKDKMIAICIAKEPYSDREIRSLVNAGAVPLVADKIAYRADEFVYIEGLADAIKRKEDRIMAKLVSKRKVRDVALRFAPLDAEQRKTLLAGGFVGYHKKKRK